MTKKEAIEKLSEMNKNVHDLIKEMCRLADEHGLGFSLYPAYGMGGYYIGKGSEEASWYGGEYYSSEEGFWQSSSAMC